MSKQRLQVVLDESELRAFRRAAKRSKMTLSEWVRQTLRRAERETDVGSAERKLEALRRAGEWGDKYGIPSPDPAELRAEIDRAYSDATEQSLGLGDPDE